MKCDNDDTKYTKEYCIIIIHRTPTQGKYRNTPTYAVKLYLYKKMDNIDARNINNFLSYKNSIRYDKFNMN